MLHLRPLGGGLMNRLVIRLVTLLLVPALLADPGTSAGVRNYLDNVPHGHVTRRPSRVARFSREAMTGLYMGARFSVSINRHTIPVMLHALKEYLIKHSPETYRVM